MKNKLQGIGRGKHASPVRAGIVMTLGCQRGGAELMLQHLLRASVGLPSIRYFLVFFEPGDMVDEAIKLGYPVRVLAAGRLRDPSAILDTIKQIRDWIRSNDIQVVMSWMSKAHLYVGAACRLARVPAIWWQHAYPARHWIDRVATLIPAARVFACSRAAARSQRELKPARPVQVIYPAVDLSRFSDPVLEDRQALRARLGLPLNGSIIGIVGRLQRWKGIHLVLDAAASLAARIPDLCVVVVGGEHSLEPGYLPALQEQAARLRIANRVRFTGYQTNTGEWMAAMDIMINASQSEPFGMVVIEAMAAGTPVIAVNQGGPAEVITSGIDGVLIDSPNAAELAKAVERLLEAPELRSSIVRHAKDRALEFGIHRLARQTALEISEVSQR